MTLIEKLDNRFPSLGKKTHKFSKRRKTTVWQDMLLCAAVTLACAFYEFEQFFPAFAADAIRITLMFLFIACWLWCAFLNGFWKKYSFLVFTAVFWGVPRLIVVWRESMGILDYNKYLDAAAQYSRLITDFSVSGLSDLLNTGNLFVKIALLAWCLFLYSMGGAFGKSLGR